MAVREYVGARYVPLFHTPLEWSETETYEPLEIVIYQGASYTSRQYVPAGINILNETYWACTGNYNSQIEAYRKEVASVVVKQTAIENDIDAATANISDLTAQLTNANTKLNAEIATREALSATVAEQGEDIEALKGKYGRILIIGDSWCQGYYANTEHSSVGVGTKIAELLNPSATVVNASVSGSGYVVGSKTFIAQAREHASEDFDLILVIGGVNDADNQTTVSEESMYSTVYECMAYIAGTWSGAEVHVFGLNLAYGGKLTTSDSIGGNKRATVLTALKKGVMRAKSSNIFFHDGVYRWGWFCGPSTYDDGIHMTETGYQLWANIAAKCIRTGVNSFYPNQYGVISSYNGSGDVQVDQVYENNGVINVKLAIHCTANNPIGTNMKLPEWAAPGVRFYLPNASNTANGAILAFDTDGTISVQFQPVPNNEWIFIATEYIAGM